MRHRTLAHPAPVRKLARMRLGKLFVAALGALSFLGVATPALSVADDDPLAKALSMPVASELVGARSAPRFAWVVNEAGVRNLWMGGPVEAPRKMTDYTADDGQLIYDLRLSDDGFHLAYVRGGDGEFPDGPVPNPDTAADPPKQQVFYIAKPGAAPRAIGEGHDPAFDPRGTRIAFTHQGEIWLWPGGASAKQLAKVPGDVTDLSWSPDGTRLLFTDNRGDHSFVAVLNVGDGTLRYLDPALGNSVDPVFSPDGKRVAFIRVVDPPAETGPRRGIFWSIRVVDVESGAARELWAPPPGMGATYAGTRQRNLYWTADGTLIFPWEATGWLHPYALDAAKGGAPRDLTPGDYEVETFLPAPDGQSLIVASGTALDLDSRHLSRITIADGASVTVTQGKGFEVLPAFAGTALGAIATDATHPAHILLADSGRALGATPEAASFVTPLTITYPADDGVTVHAQYFRASGSGPHPALVFVHGGPRRQMLPGFMAMGYYSNAYIVNQMLVARGYDVLSINYRSGTGYGQAFRDAPNVARDGAAEYRDVIAGGRWLAARPEVDAKRVGIWGGSWGGYLTALALARNSDVFAAGVDFHGVHAMVRPVEKTYSPDAEAAAHQKQWDSSPMGSIEHWRSPVLLIHGDDDKSVDFYQSLLLARELTARGVPFEQRVFPDERHEFHRYAHWLESDRALLDFLDRRLARRGSDSTGTRP